MPTPTSTTVARLPCDEASARRVADALAERFEGTAISAFEGADRRWVVEAYFAEAPDEQAVLACVTAALGAAAADALVFRAVESKDWIAASLAGLPPVLAGRFTVHGAHDRARVAANRIGIEIEAALAFGTGHHATTRGCLLALGCVAKRRRGFPNGISGVLDVGTGTGVLAIAAAKSLRAHVLASDIDAESVAISRANARLNGVQAFVECLHAGGLGHGCFGARAPFDLVFANILLDPLRRLARPLSRLTAPGAGVVLSGLLASQGTAALAAYRPHGFTLERRIGLDEWVTLILRRR